MTNKPETVTFKKFGKKQVMLRDCFERGHLFSDGKSCDRCSATSPEEVERIMRGRGSDARP